MVETDTSRLLYVRFYSKRTTVSTQIFFGGPCEKYIVADAVCLWDDASWLLELISVTRFESSMKHP